ncbi:MAG: alpha-L-fucosidase, partial [Thermoguttaceae bacterium]
MNRQMFAWGLVLLMGLFALTGPLSAEESRLPRETSPERDARMQWWRDARFGMFIHWGLYAIPAGTWDGKQISGIGEWIMDRANVPVAEYEKLAPRFNP